MELLKTQFTSTAQFPSSVSLSSLKFSFKTRTLKIPSSFYTPNSKPSIYPPFLSHLRISQTQNLHVSARFGRRSNRRNSLRKKLLEDPQVRQKLISLDPNRSFDDNESFKHNLDYDSDSRNVTESSIVEETALKSRTLGDSVLLNKLENWVDQYKKDIEFWGIGSGHIFTVFQDLNGNVERVVVNEDEILRRSGRRDFEDLSEVNLKLLHAKGLAREMESGNCVIHKNSSVAKFVVSGEKNGFVNVIQGVARRPHFYPKLSRVGISVLCGLFLFWAAKSLFSVGNREVKLTRLEKEMLRRKIKSRMEKEKLEKGSVEVVQDSSELPMVISERPKLDKQELMNSILKVQASNVKLVLQDTSRSQATEPGDLDDKIQEIREMARRAREIEGGDYSPHDSNGEENRSVEDELSDETEVVEQHGEEEMSFRSSLSNEDSVQTRRIIDGTIEATLLNKTSSDDGELFRHVASKENGNMQATGTSSGEVSDDIQSTSLDLRDGESTLDLLETREVVQCLEKSSSKMKPRVIRSVKEAREYLSRKCDKQEPRQEQVGTMPEDVTVLSLPTEKVLDSNKGHSLERDDKLLKPSSGGAVDFTDLTSACEGSVMKVKEFLATKICNQEDAKDDDEVGDIKKPITSHNHEGNGSSTSTAPSLDEGNWMERNFHEFEPVVKRIGAGFRDKYMVAREKVNQDLNMNSEVTKLRTDVDDDELEWMNDDNLREIVFQVRENELAGHDPFYMMDAEDKVTFFKGLERKADKENEKLLNLHEWIHSNIENLDYGADGISIYDPLEKIIPRWKGPPADKKPNPEFLDKFVEQQKAIVAANTGIQYPVKDDEKHSLQRSKESPSNEKIPTSSQVYDPNNKFHDGVSKKSRTIIEGSDGSVRAGKKSGKEYWQHTKKWSHGFMESYNAETDPEVKSILKDIGKDLDRWITEKEIQEAADLMAKLPERNKQFMERKLEKLKREMELFGPQAVVSKYREYAEEKEEDYLWWLDLPCVLCIELYTKENGEQKVGFYSLEMAADLELDPKQYHVIAFEDSRDCKNLCYVIQAHMDMIGNGLAFVVARPPKDAFREAKANGFSVTVIRKGELQLNVDQTLEEVEEQITEIGSKIYHDKIMQERSVDISSLMKGVFGASKPPTKRKRSERKLKKPPKR